MFGGTTNRWGGWCRPLDADDYEQHDWVPASGWPIDHVDVAAYDADAAALLQLANGDFDVAHGPTSSSQPIPLDDGDFENAIYQYSPRTNFGEVYGPAILNAPNVRTLLNANVTQLRLEPGTRRVRGDRPHPQRPRVHRQGEVVRPRHRRHRERAAAARVRRGPAGGPRQRVRQRRPVLPGAPARRGRPPPPHATVRSGVL